MQYPKSCRPIATFSIVAHDPENGDLGVAVESKFLAVGAVVPWARAGVGAVATQAWANTAYGPEGLRLMAAGWTAQETLDHLVGHDKNAAQRQAGLVDAAGRAAAFTGEGCFEWAGDIVGDGYACQGNILVSEDTLQAMADSFGATRGTLADRLLAALAAGQSAGGDKRGRQSAALLVVRAAGGYDGRNDRFVDLRVDDHAEPIVELTRIFALHKPYLFKSAPNELIDVSEEIARELQAMLRDTGHYAGPISGEYDPATRKALRALYGVENLEERWHDQKIDRVALEYLRQTVGDGS